MIKKQETNLTMMNYKTLHNLTIISKKVDFMIDKNS